MGYDKYLRYEFAASEVDAPSSVLDVGGGIGDFLDRHRISGVIAEMSFDSSLFGRVRSAQQFVTYDGNSLPFRDGSFQDVVCLDTLEHVPYPNRKAFLKEIRRVTAKKVILTFPTNRQHYVRVLFMIGRLYRLFRITPIMEKALQDHFDKGLPDALEVVQDFMDSGWHVRSQLVFCKTSALFLVIQQFIPFLKLDRMNAILSRWIRRRDGGTPSYMFLTASRTSTSGAR